MLSQWNKADHFQPPQAKHSRSAITFFFVESRKQYQGPPMKGVDFMQHASEIWGQMSEADKEQYKQHIVVNK